MAAIDLSIRGILELAMGDEEFKPGTVMVLSGLPEHDTGDGEDLLGQEQSKAGIFPKTLGEYLLFILGGNPDTIVFYRDDDAFCHFAGG